MGAVGRVALPTADRGVVTTDEETGQQWLRAADNGVGMTEEVIASYFAQIGKTDYCRPEFNQERGNMKAAGEVVAGLSDGTNLADLSRSTNVLYCRM